MVNKYTEHKKKKAQQIAKNVHILEISTKSKLTDTNISIFKRYPNGTVHKNHKNRKFYI